MAAKLVIVESPAKSRTLGKILGDGYIIKASLGHVRDLPKGDLGIDIENGFLPKYVIIQQKRKIIRELKESANAASAIYLATDPDREGEAISWHLIEAAKLGKDKIPIRRVVFHEITEDAVKEAFQHPRSVDMDLVNAQQARRLLDRLVGYKLSPLLWRKVQRGLSAGRVQSAAVRIIVDREREIQNFVPTEYWTMEAELAKSLLHDKKDSFRALLVGLPDGKKVVIPNQIEAEKIEKDLEKSAYTVRDVEIKEVLRQPAPPFITSTLQQEAWRKLRFTAKRTMSIAQQLYEGITVGSEGSVGLITYMRTDSTNVAATAITETRHFIRDKYGNDFLPVQPRHFGKKVKLAQEAHEAIRPTKIHREPEQVRHYLSTEQSRLYDLIWKRMVASQMAEARFDVASAEIVAKCKELKKEYLLKATSSVVKFLGFMSVYTEGRDDDVEEERANVVLPKLKTGDVLTLLGLFPEQRFTQPPSRYTEATLIRALEQKGIGRPSTYAPIISTIQEREYVTKESGRLRPEGIGIVVNDLLIAHFPRIVDLNFTARLEQELDNIAQGTTEWTSLLQSFYMPFEKTLHKVSETTDRVRLPAKTTGEICPACGQPMVIKTGRFGKFLACSGYPDCKSTMPLRVKIGVPCPNPDCGGELVERINKKKRRFYGCSRYPDCNFIMNQKPIPRPCPECGKPLISTRKGRVKCIACTYKGKEDELQKEGALS